MAEEKQDWVDRLADEILSFRGQAGRGLIAATIRMVHVEVKHGIENDIWDQVVAACGGGTWSESPTELITTIIDKLADLRETVDKLPVLADGEPAIAGEDVVYAIEADGSINDGLLIWWGDRGPAQLVMHGGYRNSKRIFLDCWHQAHDCYSTEAAARAAGGA